MGIQEDKKTLKAIAENIKKAREKKDWTQKQLAERAGIDDNTLAKIEQGVSKPEGLTLVKIIKALGVKSLDILPV